LWTSVLNRSFATVVVVSDTVIFSSKDLVIYD
jgi:hypothetical protein